MLTCLEDFATILADLVSQADPTVEINSCRFCLDTLHKRYGS